MSDEQHKCSMKKLCRNKIRNQTTGKFEPATIEKPRGFCDRCCTAVASAYRRASDDYRALQAAIGDKVEKAEGTKVSGTPTPPMPLNATVIELQDMLAHNCETSVALVAAKLGVRPQKRQKAKGFPVVNWPCIEQAKTLLPNNIDKLIAADPIEAKTWDSSGSTATKKEIDGVEAAVAAVIVHQRIDAALGMTEKRTRLAMPCPVIGCGRRTLGIDNGSTDVTCTSCNGKWSESEYHWLSSLLVEDIGRKEHAVLQWLYAESQWKLTQAEEKLAKVKKIADLDRDELSVIESWAVTMVLKEILA